ncbi:MAG: twin-arginine translocase subunit TatC [Nitrospira sp.]|nr:twin-arginine translocase subunit TatC [bacterium]MBL7049015.1 twin-arginine translocase subunit TatC [Nitrospira sp.]
MDKAPLTEHLGELRNRIVVSLVVVLGIFMFSFYYSEDIFRLLTMPLRYTINFSLETPYLSFLPGKFFDQKLTVLRPAEALWTHMKIGFISALVLSSPVLFYELWKFISPGLIEKERKYALPFVLCTSTLFLIGSLFCFFIVLPFAMNFLQDYKMESLNFSWTIEYYVDFCLKFILAFGAVFELPVVTVFLTKLGIVTPDFLAKHRKYAVLAAFVIAALLTPTPDAFNQTLMAVPIIILYEVGILASRIFNRKKVMPDSELPAVD